MNKGKKLLLKIKRPIFKILTGYIGIKELMNLFKINKEYQKKLNIGISSYKIFSIYISNKLDVLNYKKLIEFLHLFTLYFRQYSIEEIQNDLCICILNSLNYNYSYDADLNYIDLYPIYILLKNNFNVDINFIYTEKLFFFFQQQNQYYLKFIEHNISIFSRITFFQISVNLINEFFLNSSLGKKLLLDSIDLKQICFKKMRFTKNIFDILLNYFNYKYIEKICFISCKFTLNSFISLSEKLSKNLNLKKLIFWNCFINEKNIEKSIKNYHNLSYLNLKKNQINDKAISIFIEMKNIKNLFELDLSMNKITKLSILKIANSSNYLSNLKILNLTQNNLSNSIKSLFKWNNPNLIYLNLSNCSIQEKDFQNKIVNNLINLKTLILNCNKIGQKAIQFIFNLKSLLLLKLISCNLNDYSFSLLKKNYDSNLKMLFLNNNNFQSQSIIFFFQNSFCPKLNLINLSNNKLDDNIANYFIQNKKNIPIKKINVDNNEISESKKNIIYNLYETNLKLNINTFK